VAAPLTRGNTAKLYCLQLLGAAAANANGTLRILDLGCGDGRNFAELLRRHPNVEYVGVEPSGGDAEAARRNLPGAEIINASAYDLQLEPADAIASFSVLEHVVDRDAYFASIRNNLAPAGRVYLNYDMGHFGPDATPTERVKATVARGLARLGSESRYRAPVREEELERLLTDSMLQAIDDKGFNTELKLAYRSVPEERKDAFMAQWLSFEVGLNAAGFRFGDGIFRTRNLVLERV
jgi:SAM-dependent methyltransferase